MFEMIKTKKINDKRFYFIDALSGVRVVDSRGGFYGSYLTIDSFVEYYKDEGDNLFIEYRGVNLIPVG